MSSKSLFSSLVKSNSRSSSLLSQTFFRNTEEKSRSQSNTHSKKEIKNQRHLALLRIYHLLATKLKKQSYFLFCRLEANLKHQQIFEKNKKGKAQNRTQTPFDEVNLQCTARKVEEKSATFEENKLKEQNKLKEAERKVELFSERIGRKTIKIYQQFFQNTKDQAIQNKIFEEQRQRLDDEEITDSLIRRLLPPSEDQSQFLSPKQTKNKLQLKQQKIHFKKKIKVQQKRSKIQLTGALHILTSLTEENQIRKEIFYPSSKEKMAKTHHLYPQNAKVQVPDLHDNIGIFSEDNKIQTEKASEKKKRLTIVKYKGNEKSLEKYSFKSEEKKINSSTLVSSKRQSKQIQKPLKEIENGNSKQINNFKRCTISIILPEKHSSRSYNSSYQKGINFSQLKSQRKGLKKQSPAAKKVREFDKQNCEGKLKIFNDIKYKKDSSGYIGEVRAKKYESKIESILQNRKRGSMGNLAIIRNRNHI